MLWAKYVSKRIPFQSQEKISKSISSGWKKKTLKYLVETEMAISNPACRLDFINFSAPDNRRWIWIKFIFTARRQYAWPTKKRSQISNIRDKSFYNYKLSFTAHKYLSWQDLWSRSRIFGLRKLLFILTSDWSCYVNCQDFVEPL